MEQVTYQFYDIFRFHKQKMYFHYFLWAIKAKTPDLYLCPNKVLGAWILVYTKYTISIYIM